MRYGMMNHMLGYGLQGGWGWMIGFMIFRILLLVVVAVFIMKLINKHTNRNVESYSSSKAIKILQERYALGEIDEEEYTRRLKLLRD